MSASNRQECPSFETLSAWYDGEEQDIRLKAHVEHCENCQQIIADFELFDDEIARHIESIAPDKSTVQRLVKQTRYRLHPKSIRFLPFPVLWRLAACLALVLGIFGLYQQWDRHRYELANQPLDVATVAGQAEEDLDELSAFEQELIEDLIAEFGDSAVDFDLQEVAAPQPVASSSGTSDAGLRETEINANGVLQLNDISFVGYGPPRALEVETESSISPAPRPKLLDDHVRHVWLVDDATDPLRSLQALMPAHKQDFAELIAQQRDEYVLQFVVQDRDLQELVNHFDALNYKLISPNSPQPGNGDELRLTGKRVQYEVDFVRK